MTDSIPARLIALNSTPTPELKASGANYSIATRRRSTAATL